MTPNINHFIVLTTTTTSTTILLLQKQQLLYIQQLTKKIWKKNNPIVLYILLPYQSVLHDKWFHGFHIIIAKIHETFH